MSESETPLNLNLGCGEKKISNYINIDSRPECNPDLVCDIRRLPYNEETVDRILASDILEHVGRLEVESVLREWYRVLKPGGQLLIKTPNVDTIIDAYQTKQIDFGELIRKLYGQQDYGGNIHYTGFCPNSLKQLLTNIGFKVYKIQEICDGADFFNMAIRCKK